GEVRHARRGSDLLRAARRDGSHRVRAPPSRIHPARRDRRLPAAAAPSGPLRRLLLAPDAGRGAPRGGYRQDGQRAPGCEALGGPWRALPLVLRLPFALEPVVEPAADVLLVLDAARRRPAARELVAFAREAHHDRGLLLLLQGAEHGLALADRRAPILL